MPSPASRRDSIRQSLKAGLAFSLSTFDFRSRLLAAETDRPPSWPDFTFLIVSDTHLGYKESTGAERKWATTAAELSAAPGDFVLHLGDVVDRGQEPQYAIYRRIRDTVGKPFHEIPGNHDPRDLFEKQLGIRADRSLDHGGVRFILFGNAHPDSHDGFVSAAQFAWLERECAGAVEQDLWIVFCAHVPFHTNRHPDRGWHVKPGSGQAEFYDLAHRHRARSLALFHGHFHNGLRGWDDRAPLQEAAFPSALYNQDRRLGEQGAAGYNLPEFRPGYVSATFAAGKLELTCRATGEPPTDATAKKAFTYLPG